MTDCDTPGQEAQGARLREAGHAVAQLAAAKAADPDETTGTNGTDDTDDTDVRLAEHFVALADSLFLAATDGVLAVVERIVGVAYAIVPGADLVSVVLREDHGGLATVSHNHEAAERADRLQNDLGEGPSVSAADRHGLGAAVMNDLADPDPAAAAQWPEFAARASELGVRAALSTGMFPGGDPPRFGALNFYSWTPQAFDDDARDHALILAAHAATAISAVQARTAGELREAQLAEALQSRDVIGQAKGILMERRGQNADEAFAVLQRASQDLNIKLRDVAQTLVTHRDVI
jgi:GAF domain-containing protein